MKKIAIAAFASLAALTVSACGSSDSADKEAAADTVEMPAEEAVAGIDATATPAMESTEMATGMASDPAMMSSDGAGMATSSAGAEAATTAAEKKM